MDRVTGYHNIGLANRRLQPLGHISTPGIYYLFGAYGSNGHSDSSDSGDSCDSGEVAKEVTPPHLRWPVGAQGELARRHAQRWPPAPIGASSAVRPGSQKRSHG